MRIENIVHNGVGYSMMTPDELLAAGVPQSAIDAATAKNRRALIKGECRRRILTVVNETAQSNLTAAVAVIGAKSAAQRSGVETQLLNGFTAGVAWIGAMRANVTTLAGDANADYLADASWPTCPEEVVTLAAQF